MASTEPLSPRRPRQAPTSKNSRPQEPARPRSRPRSERQDPRTVGPWQIGRTIGKGSSGRVKIATHRSTGQHAAVKIVPKQMLHNSRMSINEAGVKNDKMRLSIEREITIMKLIEHPNVMSIYEVYENRRELYLVLEYVEGGELFNYLVQRGRLHEDEALHYFHQIICGVDYCHHFNICHRDLKPENLLLDGEHNVKIADFGMANLEASGKMMETSCGSPHYASPEVVSGHNYHGASSDIWSCGVILYALLTGRLPFDDENVGLLLNKVTVGHFVIPEDVAESAQSLIRGMLTVDPAKRFTMEQIKAHPWFNKRPPRPQPAYAALPTPDQIARPFGSPDELDEGIIKNLLTLFHGTSEAQIVQALTSNEKCWEKVFYFLLVKYSERHRSNYGDEPLELDRGSKSGSRTRPKSKRPREHIVRTGAGAVRSRSRQSLVSLTRHQPTGSAAAAAPSCIASSSQDHTGGRPQHLATHPAPSISESALEDVRSEVTPPSERAHPQSSPVSSGHPSRQPTTGSQASATSSRSPRPLPDVPPADRQTEEPQGTRVTHTASTPSKTPGKVAVVPQICLQEATPSPAPRERILSIKRSIQSPQAAPYWSPSSSPKRSRSSTPSIEVPQTEDPAMQRFFHDIVDQLQTMSMRSPNLHEGALGGSTVNSPHLSSAENEIRFADAEDSDFVDEETYDQGNYGNSARSGYSRRMSDGGQSSDFVIVADSSVIPSSMDKNSRTRRLSILRPSRNSSSRAQTRSSAKQQIKAQNLRHRVVSDSTDSPQPRRVSLFEGQVPSTQHPSNKENSRMPGFRHSSRESSASKGKKKGKQPLGLTIQVPGSPMAGTFEHPGQGSRKSSKSDNGRLLPLSPASSGHNEEGFPMSPKISWFANLLPWKAVTFHLMSVEKCVATRIEAKRLLEDLGCLTLVENMETSGVLKCKFDNRGSGEALRPVKFRVEFSGSNGRTSQPPTPIPNSPQLGNHNGYVIYQTCMALTLEKGHAPTFKSLFLCLKKTWPFDGLHHRENTGLGVGRVPTPDYSSDPNSPRF